MVVEEEEEVVVEGTIALPVLEGGKRRFLRLYDVVKNRGEISSCLGL